MDNDYFILMTEMSRMEKWIGYVDENEVYKANFDENINSLKCCSSYFEIFLIFRCEKGDEDLYTPTTLLKHWKIKCRSDEVWGKLFYKDVDGDKRVPISELERMKYNRKARNKRIEAFHEVSKTKHRKSTKRNDNEDENGYEKRRKAFDNTIVDNYNDDEGDENEIITNRKTKTKTKTIEDDDDDKDSEEETIAVIRNKIKSPTSSNISNESNKKKRKYKTNKDEEEDEEAEYVDKMDNIYDYEDDEEGLEGLEEEEDEEDEEVSFAVKRKSNSSSSNSNNNSNKNRKNKKVKREIYNYSDDDEEEEDQLIEEEKDEIIKSNNHSHSNHSHKTHKKKKYFNQKKKTIGEDKSEYKIYTETIFDRKSLELYLLNHVIRAYVVEKLKESERKSKKRQTFTSILAE